MGCYPTSSIVLWRLARIIGSASRSWAALDTEFGSQTRDLTRQFAGGPRGTGGNAPMRRTAE